MVLAPETFDAERYYFPLTVLNHGFDHVRKELSGGELEGNESELDA